MINYRFSLLMLPKIERADCSASTFLHLVSGPLGWASVFIGWVCHQAGGCWKVMPGLYSVLVNVRYNFGGHVN